jgi:small-conductance mechanosensitive channel
MNPENKTLLSDIEVDVSVPHEGDTGEEPEAAAGKEKKQGVMSRFKTYLFNRRAEKAFLKESKRQEESLNHSADVDKPVKDNRRLNEYLGAIENQLDKMDEQNKMLLFYLTTVKDNNESLLKQISVLSKNNDQLFQQFQHSKKREKLAKIVAIISALLTIGLTAWRIIEMILKYI